VYTKKLGNGGEPILRVEQTHTHDIDLQGYLPVTHFLYVGPISQRIRNLTKQYHL
jgi:hypothetical protein